MAAEQKLTRKELRDPDPFVRVSSELWVALMERQKQVGIAVASLLGLLLVVAIFAQLSKGKSSEAGGALSRALEVSRRGVEGTTDPASDPDLPKFKTFKEKNEELVKQLAEVRLKYQGSEAALTATLSLGDAHFHLGNLDEASKAYGEYLAAAKPGDALRALALEGQGYVHEAKKEWDSAAKAFEQMGAASEPQKERGAFHKARVLEVSGKKPEAAAAFQRVKLDFKDSPTTRAAIDRLALLAAQGVVAPPEPEKKPADTGTEGAKSPDKK